MSKNPVKCNKIFHIEFLYMVDNQNAVRLKTVGRFKRAALKQSQRHCRPFCDGAYDNGESMNCNALATPYRGAAQRQLLSMTSSFRKLIILSFEFLVIYRATIVDFEQFIYP